MRRRIAAAALALLAAGAARAAAQQPAAPEVIREIRVHGNAAVADADVLKLAGITVGEAITDEGVTAIERRLKASGKFETIDVRKRYRSIDDPTDIAIVLLVHERPGVASTGPGIPGLPSPLRRITSSLMFLPILSYEDGYGFSYGGRFTMVDLLGAGERLSAPLTWGGTKQATLEFERVFKTGPITRVASSFGISERENPRFEIDDQRVKLDGRVERQFSRFVRLGVDASRSTVSFATLDDDLWTAGATAALDTRRDPAFPANAVYVGGGWSGLHVNDQPRINRYTTDARGYLRLVGQSVLAARAQYYTSDAPLPPYERLLLGGASTLRGFDAGAFDGDKMLVTSAEIRVPLNSVLSTAKLGVTAFMDAGKAVDFGSKIQDGRWHKGVGAGVFMLAVIRLNLTVAHGLDGGGTHVQLKSGFSF